MRLGRALAAVALFACARVPVGECDLRATAEELAGEGAEDCGFLETDDDGERAWSCFIDAFEAGEPAFLGEARSGMDSVISSAVVSNGTQVWLLSQDSFDGLGGPIDGWDCIDPYVSTGGAHPTIACTSTAPPGNHYLVCGEMCPPEACQPQPLPFEG